EIKNQPFYKYLLNENQIKTLAERYRKRIIGNNVPTLYEVQLPRKDGSLVDVEVNAGIIEWDGRRATLAILRDITFRKKLERERRASEEKYRLLLERSNDAILIIQDGRIVFSNKKANEIFGYTTEELRSHPFTHFISIEEHKNFLMSRYRNAMKGASELNTVESQVRCKDGSTIDVEIRGGLTEWEGKPAILVIVRNITERKRVEKALKDSERKMRSLLENSPDFILYVDRDEKVTYINKIYPNYSREEIIGRVLYDLIFPDYRDMVRSAIQRTFKTGITEKLIVEGFGPYGSRAWYKLSIVPFKKNNQVDSLICIASDVTELKQAEIDLRKSEEKFRRIFEISPDLYFLISKDMTILDFEGEHEQLYALPDEFLGQKLTEIMPPDISKTSREKIEKVLKTGKPETFFYSLQVGGKKRYHEARIFFYNENAVAAIIRDISELKMAKDEIDRIHELNELILETVDLSIITTDTNRKIRTYNNSSERTFGWISEEIRGRNLDILFPDEEKEDLLNEILDTLAEKEKFEQITNLKRKDGTLFVASIVVKPIKDKMDNIVGYLMITKDLSSIG
ncbi:MAG: PAS domain S-box protein, partial [Candidatus Helarchaeales archaeon]